MDMIKSELLVEGKTKRIWTTEETDMVMVESKDDLTAGDGVKHDVVLGKAGFSNRTNSNVFRLLKACGLSVAFQKEIDERHFLADQCEMVLYEVVVRREAHGSFLKRHPELTKGHVFPQLVVEFFLKTSGKRWKGLNLPADDPFIRFEEDKISLYLPDKPMCTQTPFTTFADFPLKNNSKSLEEIKEMAIKTFLIIEKAWQLLGKKLVDFKVEFGINKKGVLCLADVIDNDSWRIIDKGNYIDKQLYRDGVGLDVVTEKYRLVADLTDQFQLPQQQIILWRGSEVDSLQPFETAINDYVGNSCELKVVTRSFHKEPVRGCYEVVQLVQDVPDSVIVAAIGKSNGAGPTLSAQTSVPVITVPRPFLEFPEDVWSSLRTPSETPCMTVLSPKNAILSALQILAMRNPRLYAELRIKQEKRLCNFNLL